MIKAILTTTLLLALVPFVSEAQTVSKQAATEKVELTNKEKAVRLLKSMETGDQEPVSYINPDKYIQHNLEVADGIAGFTALLQQLPPQSAKVNTVRAFQDGDYVFTHTAYNFSGPQIGFDIFRFEDGRIVEHWDNLQETPERPNPSNRTMIDGATEVTDIEKTAENKLLVSNFVNNVFIKGKAEQLADYFDGDRYIQHNPSIADNVSSLVSAFKERAKSGQSMKYKKIHQLLGEGNFVLVVSEATMAEKSYAMYDLFRIANGKIAEHWDIREEIPGKEHWKNTNGKF